MKNVSRIVAAIVVVGACLPGDAAGQWVPANREATCYQGGVVIECPAPDAPAEAKTGVTIDPEKVDLLPQAGFQFPGDDPRLAVHVVQYWLGLGDDLTVPLYLLTNLPTVSDLSPAEAASALLDEFGGVLNTGFHVLENRKFAIGRFGDFADPNDGMFLDARIGGKLAEYAEAGSVDVLLYVTGSWRGAFPIFGDRNREGRAGNLMFLVSGLAEYLPDQVEPADDYLLALNGAFGVAIAEWGYLSLTATLAHTADGLEDRWNVSFNLLNDEN